MAEVFNRAGHRAPSRSSRLRRWRYASLLGAAGLALPHGAAAQDNADEGAGNTIVVTAQKRTESVLDVPLAVSVVSAQALSSNHVTGYDDLARTVPSLSFTNTGTSGTSRIAIRGVASASGSATVGIYLDDVSLTFPNQSFTGATLPLLFDLERVEVLKGPQGTLYGDSSMGGTVRFITAKPKLGVFEGDASGEISTTAGGGTNYTLDAMVNLPLTDTLALRVAGENSFTSGYIDRVDADTGSVVDTNINSERRTGVRASLLWQPSDDLTITPAIQYQRIKTANSGIYDLSLPNFQTEKTQAEPSRDEMYVPSLTIEKDFGDYQLTAITAYMHRSFTRQMDAVIYDSEYVAESIDPDYGAAYDAISVLPGVLRNRDRVNNWSQEVRLASPGIAAGNRYEWQVGAYANALKVRSYDDEYVYGLNDTVAEYYPDETVEDLIGDATPDDSLGYFHSVRTLKQLAVFAQGSFMVTPRLKLTAGVRQVKAWSDYTMNEGGWLADGTAAYEHVKSNEAPFTPKFAANYKLSDNASLYASAAKGFRLGGQNNTLPSYCASNLASLGLTSDGTKSYGSDSLWSYEAGFKSSLFGNRLTLNASAYRIDWNNIQQQLSLSSCGWVITQNAGDARSQGAELEMTARITKALTLTATGGYTDAKITHAAQGSSASDGQHVLYVPNFTTTLGADYERNLANGARVFVSTNWTYTGKSYGSYSVTNSDYERADYWTGNLNLGVDIEDWRVAGYVKNLLNDQTAIQKPSVLFVRQGLTVYPRTIGVSVGKHF
ncbi:TonB-dependent receptor [Novosphingobium sp. 1949]|uniref:TonB-dependent receptor n=1 Tax=Novosphingobium organovorum TaxID=2930092 RepID=A0ABT0BEM2_9SPHN|nr:TonB-dependent receptor [Novosphingobium organovorum]MCJ2183500.1 TonB-dependent receptor [Novosphingobium organovorum]